jgi:hypothetical protein
MPHSVLLKILLDFYQIIIQRIHMNEIKDREIEYYRKSVYGKDLLYILDERTANLMRCLTRNQTLRLDDKRTLELLGFTFKEVLAPRN